MSLSLVFDKYDEMSIKGEEREKRAGAQRLLKHPVQLDMPAPQKWLTFLQGRECHKEYMKANAGVVLKACQSLYISTRDDVVKLTKNTTENVQELKSNTEDSDTYFACSLSILCQEQI